MQISSILDIVDGSLLNSPSISFIYSIKTNSHKVKEGDLFIARNLNEIEVAFKDWTFACIKRRATSLASMNWYGATKKQDGTNAPLDKNHWLSMLLEKPNPYMTFSEMIVSPSYCVDRSGETYYIGDDRCPMRWGDARL